jgi:hypothetical protein
MDRPDQDAPDQQPIDQDPAQQNPTQPNFVDPKTSAGEALAELERRRTAYNVQPSDWMLARRAAVRLLRTLYTHNPFYVASAWMVFWGLRTSFDVSGGPFDAWALTLGLGGYTLLLAATAFLVIRYGKVWDDARSLLLLIVLMFLGISVTFDGVLAGRPSIGVWYYLCGWIFAVAVSEALLGGLRLRLPILFRLPYHLLLALFFLYPISLAPLVNTPDSSALAWQLFGFSPLAAILLLTLLPAVRRGESYVQGNGSPWPWPWFPWVLFGMLGFCAALRAYYLCLSLHFVGHSNSIFGGYFLVPLLLAAAILLLEAGIRTGSSRALRLSSILPVVMIGLATLGRHGDGVYDHFRDEFQHALGAGPLLATMLLAAGFYLLAAVRGVRLAGEALTAVLVATSFVAPATADLGGLVAPQAWPLALAGVWQLAAGVRERTSGHVLTGLCGLLLALTLALRGTWFTGWHAALPIHLLVVVLLAVGLCFSDWLGRYARAAAAAIMVLLACLVAAGDASWFIGVPGWIVDLYPLAVAVALAGCGYMSGQTWLYAGALASGIIWTIAHFGRVYLQLRNHVIGLNQLAWGLLLFALAALISLLKSGIWQHRLKPPPET